MYGMCSCSWLLSPLVADWWIDLVPPLTLRESEASRGSRGVVGGDESLGGSDGWEALHPGLMDTAWKAVARRFMQDFQVKV